MAVFGVPHTHEDDAEPAFRFLLPAALAIQAAETELPTSVPGSIGGEHGRGGHGYAIALGGGRGGAVMGDAVNVAARLEKAASRTEGSSSDRSPVASSPRTRSNTENTTAHDAQGEAGPRRGPPGHSR